MKCHQILVKKQQDFLLRRVIDEDSTNEED